MFSLKKTGFSAFLHKAMGACDIRTSRIAQRLRNAVTYLYLNLNFDPSGLGV